MSEKLGYQWVPVGTSGYQEYQEDQYQISGATYISDVVFVEKTHLFFDVYEVCLWARYCATSRD